MAVRVGYMLRPPGDEMYCRAVAHEIFGTGLDHDETAFCETHALWWLILCLIMPWLSIIDMLEVWDYR